MTERLVVVRHAESRSALARRISGIPGNDDGLTPEGKRQALRLAERLSDIEIDVCITTEFPRTRQTAALALSDRSVKRRVSADLNDPFLGDFEGVDLERYLSWLRSTPMNARPSGGGESQLDSVARYERGWREVVTQQASCLLVVCHAFPISLALTLAREQPPLLRADYEEEVKYAEPHELDVAALRRSLDGLLHELAGARRRTGSA